MSRAETRVFAFLMAAIFALALVPRGALAASGVMGTTTGKGTIKIANTTSTETYNIYRIFDLASFNDSDPAPGTHTDEQYSYVISGQSDWYDYLTDNKLYAASEGCIAVVGSSTGTAKGDQLFWFEPAKLTLAGPDGREVSDYHIVVPTDHFQTAWDVDNVADNQKRTYKYDEQDYANPAPAKTFVKITQDFAQAALAHAKLNNLSPNYIEQGTGTIDTPAEVTVNSATTSKGADADNTSPKSGKVYLGWYLMGTSMGTLASLDTTNPNVTLYEKSVKPDLKKRVLNKRVSNNDSGSRSTLSLTADQLEDTTAESTMWVKNTDADVGDYVLFKTVITNQQGIGGYVLHDVMEQGLEFVDKLVSDKTNQYLYYDSAAAGATQPIYTVSKNGSDQYDYRLRIYHIDYETTYDQSGNATSTKSVREITRTLKEGTDDEIKNFEVKTTGLSCTGCDFEVRFNDLDTSDNEYTYSVDGATNKNVSDKDKLVVLYWAKVKPDINTALWDAETTASNDRTVIKDNLENNLDDSHQVAHYNANSNGRNDNYTILTYGTGSHTKVDQASVTSYQLDIAKTGAISNGTYPLLGGATFKVYKANATSEANGEKDSKLEGGLTFKLSNGLTYYATSAALAFKPGTLTGGKPYYLFAGDAADGTAHGTTTALTSSEQYEINLRGLEAGTYLIVEESAPTGYNKLAYPIVVTITGDGNNDGASDSSEGTLSYTAKKNSEAESAAPAQADSGTTGWDAQISDDPTPYTYATANNGGIHVINQTGSELPSTGGIGTTIFYVVGGVLVVGSAIMLVTKRRMASGE